MKKKDLIAMPDFFDRYINLVSDEITLLNGLEKSKNDFDELKEELIKKQDYRYQEGKWTPKEVIQHIIDNERIQAYRALVFSRNDFPILPGYDENFYSDNSNAINRSMEEIMTEFKTVRESSIALFQSFSPEMYHHTGICSDIEITPLALGLVLIGHQTHHLKVLKERYLK